MAPPPDDDDGFRPDELRAARGCVVGLALALPLWALVLVVAVALAGWPVR